MWNQSTIKLYYFKFLYIPKTPVTADRRLIHKQDRYIIEIN